MFADRIGISRFKGDFMKRILCLLLAAAMLFSFAACSDDNKNSADSAESTTVLPPEIEETVYSKEFKDESGKTVIKVSVTLPQITEFADKKVMDHINAEAMDIFNGACDFAERNIENASNFMKSVNSSKPWSKKVTFESTLINDRYACFLVKDSLSYYDSETEPGISTACFDVRTGAECRLSDFSTYTDDPALGFEAFLHDVMVPALPKRFPNPSFLNEEVYSRIGEFMTADSFYLTEDGIGFYFNKKDVHEYLDGTFKIRFTWNELSAFYEMPELK